MAFQTPDSDFPSVSGDIAVVQSSRKGWFSKITNGLSIGNKIKFGYSLALGVGIVGTTIGLILGDRYQQQALQQQQNAFKEINLLYRLQTSILQTRTYQQQLIPLVANLKLYKEEYAHITNTHAPEIKQVWLELQTYIKTTDYTNEKHRENIPLLLKTYEGVTQTYIQQLEELSQQLDLSPLTEIKIAIAQRRLLKFTNSELALKFDSISDELVTVINTSYEELQVATTTFKTVAQIRIQIIVASILLSAVIATLLAFLTSRTITHPVKVLTNVAQRVTKESNFDLQAPVITTDEIGILATAFNQVLHRVKCLLEEQQAAAFRQQQMQEAQLLQSEKMSSLGRMVAGIAGIAHEINNPVNFIYGNLDPAIEHVDDLLALLQTYRQEVPSPPLAVQDHATEIDAEFVEEDLPKVLQSMKFGADRVRQIVLSLKNFSRLDEAETHAVDLHECIESTLLILNNRIKKGITIERCYGDIPNIEGFSSSLYQVFMNIINNALDALEEEHNTQDKPRITIATELQDKNWVVVRIADNGSGIAPETQEKIFEMFFTTKPTGVGTGMGLSISHQIVVEKHGGRLICKSEVGSGTEFTISLPVQKQYLPKDTQL
ncbi:MAG: ATP-binding protein [Nostoc sp.]|uniref:HAMP domain-containing sensor histidine kinase n=1 Tax=Nostoc sp. TaxID=1180 RepID=UPI002FF7C759